eukprot:scaffold9519_cov183-Amphora_coffeaeformis.AAC.3
MSNPSEEISMFVFCLCLVLEDCLELVKCVDEYCFGVGQRVAIKASARFEMLHVLFTMLFHIPALIITASEFFPRSSHYSRRLAGEDVAPGFEGDKKSTNVPILLVLASGWLLLTFISIGIIFLFPKNGKHKEKYVVDCVLHWFLASQA